MRKVVVISDCTDVAFLEMRGVISKYAGDVEYQIEPLVKVDNFSIVNTEFLVRLIAENYPEGTIIMAIVNPEIDRPERIIGRTKNNIIFEGPNTGAFAWLVEDFGVEELYEIFDNGFVPFGGKYVHSPTVGNYLSGMHLNELGEIFPAESLRPSKIVKGTVVHIDNFGNVKLNYKLDKSLTDGIKFNVRINGIDHEFLYWRRMMERNDGELIIYPGSSLGLVELGMVRGKLTDMIPIQIGDSILIEEI